MTSLSHRARKEITQRIDAHADEISAGVLLDDVVLADDGAPETLYHLAEALAGSYHAMDLTYGRRGRDSAPVHDYVDSAYGDLSDALDLYVEELVADRVANVILDADQIRQYRDPDAVDEAVVEARGWLQRHIEAARRAGVLEELKRDDETDLGLEAEHV